MTRAYFYLFGSVTCAGLILGMLGGLLAQVARDLMWAIREHFGADLESAEAVIAALVMLCRERVS